MVGVKLVTSVRGNLGVRVVFAVGVKVGASRADRAGKPQTANATTTIRPTTAIINAGRIFIFRRGGTLFCTACATVGEGGI